MIRLKKGLDVPIAGAPRQEIVDGPELSSVALVGADYPGLMPTMRVAEGDRVLKGQTLFADKKNPAIQFSSPVTGMVKAINRGENRVFQSIEIVPEAGAHEAVRFDRHEPSALVALGGEFVRQQLLNSGLWVALRSRPFGRVADPKAVPAAIFVNAMDTNPLAADPAVVIRDAGEAFRHGLDVLSCLGIPVRVVRAAGSDIDCGRLTPDEFAGPHPAGLVGTHIHFLEPVSAHKQVWHLDYQDVIAFGRLFTTGELDARRVISVAGPVVNQPTLVRTTLGADIPSLVANGLSTADVRLISGSVLSGRQASGVEKWLGRYHLQVSALAEGRDRQLLHYLRPGMDRHSVLRAYVGRFFRKSFAMTTSTQGSERAMVPVGTYEQVMPLDILPTQLLRYLLVNDTDMAQALGVLELVEEDLGLCTYVCPGKYEYGPILRDVLNTIEKEG